MERRRSWGARLVADGAIGAFGGAVVGVAEGVAVLSAQPGLTDYGVLWYGPLLYAILGAPLGLIGGVLAALANAGSTVRGALAGAVACGALGGAAGSFRILRDLLHEQVRRTDPLGLAVSLGALAVAAAVGWALGRLAAGAGRRLRGEVIVPLAGVGLLAVLGMLAATVTRSEPRRVEPPQAKGDGPPIVLILVDTLRADVLSCYGHPGGLTPQIDALARDGVLFRTAVTQASWTRPSVATILSSLYPSSHRAQRKPDVLPADVLTLPEVLAEAGYFTAGFANNVNVTSTFGFDQGYAQYSFLAPDFFFGAPESASSLAFYSTLRLVRERFARRTKYVRHYYQPAEVVTERAIEWLDAHGDTRFFLLLHYMDPHDPYFVHPYNGEAVARVAEPRPAADRASALRALYEGEVRHLDRHLGELFAALRALDIYDRALIVLTSDHGEEFREHGGWWHGQTLYDEQIRVPLIIKLPGQQRAGTVVEHLATSLDLAPTVLALARLRVPEVMQGRPLDLTGRTAVREGAYSEEDHEGNVLASLRTVEWKLIEANDGNPRGLARIELFNLRDDPEERHDLSGEADAARARLLEQMARAHEEAGAAGVRGERRELDAATTERLRALGYVD